MWQEQWFSGRMRAIKVVPARGLLGGHGHSSGEQVDGGDRGRAVVGGAGVGGEIGELVGNRRSGVRRDGAQHGCGGL